MALLKRQRAALRRWVSLFAASLVLPGSAQLIAGDRRIGKWVTIAFGTIALLAVAGLLWVSPQTWIRWSLRPTFLWFASVFLITLGAVWAGMLWNARQLARPRQMSARARTWTAVATTTAMLVVTGPPVFAGRMMSHERDLLASMFPSTTAAAASDGRMNVLLLGGDSGADRIGMRTDTIMVASTDVTSGATTLLQLPRNLEGAPFPKGSPAAKAFPDGYQGKDEYGGDRLLNGVYMLGTQRPELFPGAHDPGLEAAKQAVSTTLGLPIHYSAIVDIAGFQRVIDALGGVTIRTFQPQYVGREKELIAPGLHHFDGLHALWYARYRHTSSDYSRMDRQRCVVGALVNQIDPMNVVKALPELLSTGKGIVQTDIPQSELPKFVDLAYNAKGIGLNSVTFTPPLIHPGNPDFDLIRRETDKALDAARKKGQAQPARASGAAASPAGGTAASAPSPKATPTPAVTPNASGSEAPVAEVDKVCAYE